MPQKKRPGRQFTELMIELRPSIISQGGIGVFAVRDIPKNTRVAEGMSENDFNNLTPWEELDCCSPEIKKKVTAFCAGTPEGFFPPADRNFNKLSVEWCINHSCDGNLGFDRNGDFTAKRNIRKDEELGYDYGLFISYPWFRLECSCGAKTCRKIVTGNDWKTLPTAWMHPHLKMCKKRLGS